MKFSIGKLEYFYFNGSLWFNIGNWINIHLENPLKTWWKARKYFKFPNISIYGGKLKYSFPYACKDRIGKILDINFSELGWKDKYDSPRHESNPYIFICLFRFLYISIIFHKRFYDEIGRPKNGSMEYWEYILDYLYYKKKLTLASSWVYTSKIFKTIDSYGESEDGSEDKYKYMDIRIPIEKYSLNKRGIKELCQEMKF